MSDYIFQALYDVDASGIPADSRFLSFVARGE